MVKDIWIVKKWKTYTMSILEIYEAKCNDNSDICQHLPTLKKYAEECEVIIELGVRSVVSTWAFLAAKPRALLCVDLYHPSHYIDYDSEGCNIDLAAKLATQQLTFFEFICHDSRTVKLPKCDLMFFDTLHTYEQLTAELNAHSRNVEKYMIFHDTETFKDELMPAINNFLYSNSEWYVKKQYFNNNGLTILKHN